MLSQKRQKQQSLTGTNKNVGLQMNLLKIWTKYKVSDNYQNIFLLYLDQLSDAELESKITSEIKLTIERKSPYFVLESLQKNRSSIIDHLQSLLAQQEDSLGRQGSQQKLNQVCQLLKQLRESNLQATEVMLKLQKLYNCEDGQAKADQMEYFNLMFEQLDKDNQFLKESAMNEYIVFDDGYDPFLMNYYESYHKGKVKIDNEAIKKLYMINISHAYRLMKAKNNILELRSLYPRSKSGLDNSNKLQSPSLSHNQAKKRSLSQPKTVEARKYSVNDNRKYGGKEADNLDNSIYRRNEVVKLQPLFVMPPEIQPFQQSSLQASSFQQRPNSSSQTEKNINPKHFYNKFSYPALNSKKQKLHNPKTQDPLSISKPLKKSSTPVRYLETQPPSKQQYRQTKPLMKLQPLKIRQLLRQDRDKAKDKQDIHIEQSEDAYKPKSRLHSLFFNTSIVKHKTQPGEQQNEQRKEEYNVRRYYNPLKDDKYVVEKQLKGKPRYDFKPQKSYEPTHNTLQQKHHAKNDDNDVEQKIKSNYPLKHKMSLKQDYNYEGLNYEQPISKFNRRQKNKLSKFMPDDQDYPQSPSNRQKINSQRSNAGSYIQRLNNTRYLDKHEKRKEGANMNRHADNGDESYRSHENYRDRNYEHPPKYGASTSNPPQSYSPKNKYVQKPQKYQNLPTDKRDYQNRQRQGIQPYHKQGRHRYQSPQSPQINGQANNSHPHQQNSNYNRNYPYDQHSPKRNQSLNPYREDDVRQGNAMKHQQGSLQRQQNRNPQIYNRQQGDVKYNRQKQYETADQAKNQRGYPRQQQYKANQYDDHAQGNRNDSLGRDDRVKKQNNSRYPESYNRAEVGDRRQGDRNFVRQRQYQGRQGQGIRNEYGQPQQYQNRQSPQHNGGRSSNPARQREQDAYSPQNNGQYPQKAQHQQMRRNDGYGRQPEERTYEQQINYNNPSLNMSVGNPHNNQQQSHRPNPTPSHYHPQQKDLNQPQSHNPTTYPEQQAYQQNPNQHQNSNNNQSTSQYNQPNQSIMPSLNINGNYPNNHPQQTNNSNNQTKQPTPPIRTQQQPQPQPQHQPQPQQNSLPLQGPNQNNINSNNAMNNPPTNNPMEKGYNNNSNMNSQQQPLSHNNTNPMQSHQIQPLNNNQNELKSNPIIPQTKQLNGPVVGKQSAGYAPERNNGQINNGVGSNIRQSTSQIDIGEKSLTGKKQIKMKIGKQSLGSFTELLKGLTIPANYKQIFEFQKLLIWIANSQTYLTEFLVNDKRAIVALCSPIPNVGIALKAWFPLIPEVDSKISANLFRKYVQFIQKSSTALKIVYNGAQFQELKQSQFVVKKQKLYEKARTIPAKQQASEFKPFLYVECSNIKFAQKSKQAILFSEQIPPFQPQKFYAADYIGNLSYASIPQKIKPLVKYSQNLADFKQVNKILSDEQFDNYEANMITINSINLLRLYYHSSFRTVFVANNGSMRFSGNVHHEAKSQLIISLPAAKDNCVLYFGKNITISSFLQKVKQNVSSRVQFGVKMFSKKLYGRLQDRAQGCYGNWQINLTWQDEIQGVLKYDINEKVRYFGGEQFLVGVEFEKEMVYVCQIAKDDFLI